MIAIKNTARTPYFFTFLCDSSISNPLEMDLPFSLSCYSCSKISSYAGVNAKFYGIRVAKNVVYCSPSTYNSLWGAKPPLPCSSRVNVVISPNLWHGRVSRNTPSPLKPPFSLFLSAIGLTVCDCHDKRLRFSRFLVRLFFTIFVVVLFFRFFSSKWPSFCISEKYLPVNRN